MLHDNVLIWYLVIIIMHVIWGENTLISILRSSAKEYYKCYKGSKFEQSVMIPFCYFDQRFYIHKCWQSAKIENKMTMIIWKILANCGFCLCHTVDCLSTFISSLYATIAPVISVHNVLLIFTWYIGTCACVAFWQKKYMPSFQIIL